LQKNIGTDPRNISIAHRHMNIDIGTEAAQIPETEYINRNFRCSLVKELVMSRTITIRVWTIFTSNFLPTVVDGGVGSLLDLLLTNREGLITLKNI